MFHSWHKLAKKVLMSKLEALNMLFECVVDMFNNIFCVNQINPSTLIGQSTMVYCGSKLMEKLCVL